MNSATSALALIEESYVHHVGIKHQSLIDVAGSNHFLVDDGTDIQTFCHAHVIHVFDGSYGLAHTHSLGGEAGEDIGLRISRQCHESLGASDSFLCEERNVAAIAVIIRI